MKKSTSGNSSGHRWGRGHAKRWDSRHGRQVGRQARLCHSSHWKTGDWSLASICNTARPGLAKALDLHASLDADRASFGAYVDCDRLGHHDGLDGWCGSRLGNLCLGGDGGMLWLALELKVGLIKLHLHVAHTVQDLTTQSAIELYM
jgi:hypothetical protein